MKLRRALLAVLATGLAAGSAPVTFGAFTATTSSVSTFAAATTFAPLTKLGSAQCEATTSTITIGPGGVPAGTAVVVIAAARPLPSSGGVSDSRGNAYALDSAPTEGSIRSAVFHSFLAAALQPGDAITISSSPVQASAAVALTVAGATAVDAVQSEHAGTANPSTSVTTSAAGAVLVGSLSNEDTATVTAPLDWTTVSDVDLSSCAAPAHFHVAYRRAATPGSYTWAPSLSQPRAHAMTLIALRP